MQTPEVRPELSQPLSTKNHTNRSSVFASHQTRSELIRVIISAVLIFVLVIIFDLGDYLAQALEQTQEYHIDEIIASIVVCSFMLVIFLFRGWRTVRQEAMQRAFAVEQIQRRSAINAELSQMTSLLHSCFALDEASSIIAHFARHLFPEHTGFLYVFRSSRNLLELTTTWGESEGNEPPFGPHECWGLRQGQMYAVRNPKRSIVCGHVHHTYPYTCLPLMAHGEVLALLHVFLNSDHVNDEASREAQHALLRVFSEPVALALSNLKLRESLRQQSIRDPLTGLFNRRYLEETLLLEVERAKRNKSAFSIIMMDLDHFKRFNDTHGHEAGDAVLKVFGSFLQQHIRGGDIACRYGGEEFTLILPGTSLENAQQRAEQLCDGIRVLNIDFQNQILGPLSLSVGIAAFPVQGETGELVLQAADAALYRAKAGGRDRVVVAV